MEEYLEAVHELAEDGIPVIQARLAERLGHSAPTVSEMVHRLKADGYINIEGRAISLTPKGQEQAHSVVRKHRLAERLLTDIIGLEWHKAHTEATRWEHVISDEVESRLVQLLNNPTTCPHGNPIPGAAKADDSNHVRLSEAASGSSVTLARVPEQVEFSSTWLTYLGEQGFVPGTTATVESVTNNGDYALRFTDDRSVVIEAELAGLLYVTI